MTTAFRAVCEALLRINSTDDKLNFCCLCFDPVGEDATQVNDEVIWDSDHVSEPVSNILVYILGDAVKDIVDVLTTVCDTCLKSLLNNYIFVRRCKDNMAHLTQAVDNLTGCFAHTMEDVDTYQSLFVSINPKDLSIEQYYDNRRQVIPCKLKIDKSNFAPQVSMESTNDNGKLDAGKPKKKERDFSTIFIKTKELVADPTKPNEYRCKMCLKLYPMSGGLRQHFFTHHFKKDYPCPDCPKSFGTSGLLNTHRQQSHYAVTCHECGKQLLNRSSTLRRHMLTHKRVSKICDRCGRSYKKITDYNRHMEQETCLMPSRVKGMFVCDYCGKECHFRHQLLSHIKYEHLGEKGHICPWCGRNCYNESALKTHVVKHTKEKNFVCNECGGRFVTRQSLLNHTRLHTGERPYPCEFCEQGFLSASRRRDHVERHHINASFQCDLCDAKYNARRSLIKHRKRHFMNEQ